MNGCGETAVTLGVVVLPAIGRHEIEHGDATVVLSTIPLRDDMG